LRYRRSWDAENETTATVWTAWRDFENNLPIFCDGAPGGVNGKLDRIFSGGSLQHVYSADVFAHENTLLVGLGVEAQRDERSRHCQAGGAKVLDQDEDVTSVRLFLRDEFSIVDNVVLSFSLGFDTLRYEVSDHLSVTPSNPDDSGHMEFSEWSPSAALRWTPSEALSLYTRVSTSFEPPTTTELRVEGGGGGFNSQLEAQRAVNFEGGIKGLLVGTLRYEVAAYGIWTDDEILPFESAGGQEYFRNAGKTRRHGVEAMLEYEFLPGLIATASYTYSHAEFRNYVVGADDRSGKEVPGFPEQHAYAELRYVHSSGLYAALEGRYVGEFWADDANTVHSDSYALLDARAGWRGNVGAWRVGPYLAVQNLSDSEYDDNIRINAFGGRYFEPAPGLTVQGGISLGYEF